jgi:organic radical activating enzyme
MKKKELKRQLKLYSDMALTYPNDRKRFAERYAADIKTQLEQNEKIREAIGNQLSDMCVMHDSVLLKFERLQADHDKLQQAYERLHAEHMQAQTDANAAQEIIEKLRVKLMLKFGEIAEACEHSRIIEEDRNTMARHLAAALKAQEATE